MSIINNESAVVALFHLHFACAITEIQYILKADKIVGIWHHFRGAHVTSIISF